MSCRCAKIRQLEQELSDLKKAKQYISDAIDSSYYVSQREKEGGESFRAGFSLMLKQLIIASGIETNFNSIKLAIEDAFAEINSSIIQTQNTLSSYYSEDRNYHEEERLKALAVNTYS